MFTTAPFKPAMKITGFARIPYNTCKRFSTLHYDSLMKRDSADLMEIDKIKNELNESKINLLDYCGWRLDYSFIPKLLSLGLQSNMDHIQPFLRNSENIVLPSILPKNTDYNKEWMGIEIDAIHNGHNSVSFEDYLLSMCDICDNALQDANNLWTQNISRHEYFNYTLYSFQFKQEMNRLMGENSDQYLNGLNDKILVQYERNCSPNAAFWTWQPKKHLTTEDKTHPHHHT